VDATQDKVKIMHNTTEHARDVLSMPAQWEAHERCLMSWPSRDYWQGVASFDDACREWAGVANAVARFEPVLMIAAPGTGARARTFLDPTVEVIELPVNDAWMRDNGPIFVTSATRREAVHFGFNGWGQKFPPWEQDAAVAALVLEHLGVPKRSSSMVLEGGSVLVDGQGTLITTEQCLLHPNRNPNMSKDAIEAELKRQLGVTKVIWLPYGHVEDRHTDGHVDGVLAYLAPGRVMVQTCDDPAHPDHHRLRENLRVLRETTDARGRVFEVIEMPYYPYFHLGDHQDMVSYVNFYRANGLGGHGAIVPLAGHEFDNAFLALLRAWLPGVEVVGVPARLIAYGGGGPHCITQQVPVLPPEVRP
jgi:agmatine deiminase